jgi:hypothetical protein
VIPSLSLKRNLANLESFALTLMPHGGQRSARRNAWASMSSDSALARSRREADAAMERAIELAELRSRRQELAAR